MKESTEEDEEFWKVGEVESEDCDVLVLWGLSGGGLVG